MKLFEEIDNLIGEASADDMAQVKMGAGMVMVGPKKNKERVEKIMAGMKDEKLSEKEMEEIKGLGYKEMKKDA